MRPMTTFSRIQAATTRTRSAEQARGKRRARPGCSSMPPGYSRSAASRARVRRASRGQARAAARAASSAGRCGGVQAPAHPPGRAAEGEVGDRGEARLVGAQREQQVGDAVARRAASGSSTPTHQQYARRAAARDEQRARLPDAASRRARPRSSTSPVRACSSRASWPTRSPSRPSARARRAGAGGRAARWAHDVRAALRVELGDDPRVRERDERDRAAPAAGATTSSTPRGEERHDVRDRGQRPQPRRAAQRARVDPRAPVDGRELGEQRRRRAVGAATRPPLSRRRSAGAGSRARRRRGSSRTCSAWPSPVETMAK